MQEGERDGILERESVDEHNQRLDDETSDIHRDINHPFTLMRFRRGAMRAHKQRRLRRAVLHNSSFQLVPAPFRRRLIHGVGSGQAATELKRSLERAESLGGLDNSFAAYFYSALLEI